MTCVRALHFQEQMETKKSDFRNNNKYDVELFFFKKAEVKGDEFTLVNIQH